MNKILSTLLVGFFAVSVNAFAAAAPAAAVEAAPAATEAATPTKSVMQKHTAAPAKKAKHKKTRKTCKS